jgi:soluble lytic murein transglycosylase-like protein
MIGLSLLCCLPPAHACWDTVAQRHRVPADLLYAIAQVESRLNPRAVNRTHLARTRSYDIGLMQINSRHLPKLARYGVDETRLYEPCTNLDVGAWLLADIFRRKGFSWDSVGAYNTACTQLKGEDCTRARARYAWNVYRQLPDIRKASKARQTAARPVTSFPARSALPARRESK